MPVRPTGIRSCSPASRSVYPRYLGIARLDMAAGALGAAWFQMTALEQALDDPAAVGD
jgi:hypothetical protein